MKALRPVWLSIMCLCFVFGSNTLKVLSKTCTGMLQGSVRRARDFACSRKVKKNEAPAMIKRTREVERREKLVGKGLNMSSDASTNILEANPT